MSVCQSACLPVCMYVCLSVCLPACLPACMYVCLPVCMSVCLFECLSVCQYVNFSYLTVEYDDSVIEVMMFQRGFGPIQLTQCWTGPAITAIMIMLDHCNVRLSHFINGTGEEKKLVCCCQYNKSDKPPEPNMLRCLCDPIVWPCPTQTCRHGWTCILEGADHNIHALTPVNKLFVMGYWNTWSLTNPGFESAAAFKSPMPNALTTALTTARPRAANEMKTRFKMKETYLCWKALLVPLWSKSWHRQPTISAMASLSVTCFRELHFYKKKHMTFQKWNNRITKKYISDTIDSLLVSCSRERHFYKKKKYLFIYFILFIFYFYFQNRSDTIEQWKVHQWTNGFIVSKLLSCSCEPHF
jgi:hypothetical protein